MAMIISTALNNLNFPAVAHESRRRRGSSRPVTWRAFWLALAVALFAAANLPASTVLNPWTPIFKGVDYAAGKNTPGNGGFSELQAVYCLRVDLTDPDVTFFTSPRYSSYVADYTESAGYTTTNFLKLHGLQVAVNANQFYQFHSTDSPDYLLPEGTSFNIAGLFISAGTLVSPQSSADESSAFMFTSSNSATFIATNWPPASTAGINTAVAGIYTILYQGVNVGRSYLGTGGLHDLEPRTAFGLSQDRHYLFLLVIDGRQGGYSDGAYDWETAAWLQLAGASDGANMDGGGSSCMVIQDTTGAPKPLNRDSASPASGRERTVGAHFGIYAKPVPGFFTNISVLPDDTSAIIKWTTTSAATTQLKYGTNSSLSLLTASNSTPTASHSVLLTNLTPATDYYFAALSSVGTNTYTSPTLLFTTTNYVTTNVLFDFTNVWINTTNNLDGVNWTAATYNDSAWETTGPGLLWADNRGPNSNIPGLGTELPLASDGYPYPTYYFRTRFSFTGSPAGAVLQLQDYIDDGAVFYLNGAEIYRLRMPSTAIVNSTLADGYPCGGDATCPDVFSVSGSVVTSNLVAGDNVLAVEVHNYNPGSPDITFGLAAAITAPYPRNATLTAAWANGSLVLSWTPGGYSLQQAPAVSGPWSNVAGSINGSPFAITNAAAGPAQFYRLVK